MILALASDRRSDLAASVITVAGRAAYQIGAANLEIAFFDALLQNFNIFHVLIVDEIDAFALRRGLCLRLRLDFLPLAACLLAAAR